jgi:hypothetical protein
MSPENVEIDSDTRLRTFARHFERSPGSRTSSAWPPAAGRYQV